MYQNITILGNLGRDPEVKYLPSGTAICNLSVATNEFKRNRDGEGTEQTTWWRVTVWGEAAEAAGKRLHKGSKVLAEGRMTPDVSGNPRLFQKNDGTWAASYEMSADTVRFLDPKNVSEDANALFEQ